MSAENFQHRRRHALRLRRKTTDRPRGHEGPRQTRIWKLKVGQNNKLRGGKLAYILPHMRKGLWVCSRRSPGYSEWSLQTGSPHAFPCKLHSGYKGLSPTYSCAAARDSHPLPMPGGESLRRANAELAKNTTPTGNDGDSKD